MINMKLENKSQPQKFASRQPKLFRLKKMKINEFHTQTQLNQSRINVITDIDNLLKKFNDSHLQDYLGKKIFTMKLVISQTFKTFLLKYYGHIILRFSKKSNVLIFLVRKFLYYALCSKHLFIDRYYFHLQPLMNNGPSYHFITYSSLSPLISLQVTAQCKLISLIRIFIGLSKKKN